MAIKAWGPLFAWLVLAAAGIIGLFVQHHEPHNRGQPTIAENRNGPTGKSGVVVGTEHHDEKGNQKSEWYDYFKPTDWLLVIFNGFLVLYTRRLFQATNGLFGETSGLRQAAAEQRTDMLRSIAAAERAADAAIESNKLSRDLSIAENRPWLSINIIIGPRGLYFDENGVNLDLIFIIKNTGKTPAVSANIVGHPSIDIGINERIIALEM